MSIEEMDEWYFEMKEILIYNQKHLLNYPLDDYDIAKEQDRIFIIMLEFIKNIRPKFEIGDTY